MQIMNFSLCINTYTPACILPCFIVTGDDASCMGMQMFPALRITLMNANLNLYIHILHAILTALHIPAIFWTVSDSIGDIYDVKVVDETLCAGK